ncbi:hypothetical protein GS539_24255 [Rhodococcus hoagii]|nr:hypothetical protein [Prescottella equi]
MARTRVGRRTLDVAVHTRGSGSKRAASGTNSSNPIRGYRRRTRTIWDLDGIALALVLLTAVLVPLLLLLAGWRDVDARRTQTPCTHLTLH